MMLTDVTKQSLSLVDCQGSSHSLKVYLVNVVSEAALNHRNEAVSCVHSSQLSLED